MKCPDFLNRFSEFYDGTASPGDRRMCQEHLESCLSCRRYHQVVRRGVGLLRDLPPARPTDDFRARLQHSIYHVEEDRRRRRGGSSAPGLVALSLVAGVLALVVWGPGLGVSEPMVELTPIVVHQPPVQAGTLLAPGSQALPPASRRSSPLDNPDLWASSNALLFQYSPLYERYREPGLVRTGLR